MKLTEGYHGFMQKNPLIVWEMENAFKHMKKLTKIYMKNKVNKKILSENNFKNNLMKIMKSYLHNSH